MLSHMLLMCRNQVREVGRMQYFSFLALNNVVHAGDLSVVISCASLALADAGIVMYDLVAAVSLVSS